MKDANLGEYLLWEGQPAIIIAESNGRQVIIQLLEDNKCPHCNGLLGKDQTHVIVSSPQFQNGAKQIKTITDDDSLTIS